jgi:hypothetical protein
LFATLKSGIDDFQQFDRRSTLELPDTVAEYDLDEYLRRRVRDLPPETRKEIGKVFNYEQEIQKFTKRM